MGKEYVDALHSCRDRINAIEVETKGASLEVLGVGTTGYAKDILKDVLNADVALVEKSRIRNQREVL